MVLLLIAFILFIIIAIWIFGFLFQFDFTVPTLDLSTYKKILVISPHPDDEVLTVGGTVGIHKNAVLYILTKGERGTHDAHLEPKLKSVRSEEARKVAKILGALKLIHEDFGDGELEGKRDKLNKRIKEIIETETPDLIITNDLSGGYGHQDHIACSKIVTDVVKKQFPKIHLWYWTNPKRISKMINLPEQMAKNLSFKKKITSPTHKVYIGLNNFHRIQAIYAYKSQYKSFISASPLKPIPMWFLISMSFFEYFH